VSDDPRNTVLIKPSTNFSQKEKTKEEMTKLAITVEVASLDTQMMK